jgi:hypothetical protein
MSRMRPTPSAAIALIALFVALGGPAQAAKLINGGNIKRGTVTSKQVKDRSLQPRDLARGTVRSLKATPQRSIVDASLADNAVTTRALAPGSVLTGTVGDGSLTAADLGTNSVGTDEVEDNAIGQTEIRNNGVGASEIADQSIDTGEVIDGGLSAADVARWTGSFSWTLPALQAGKCTVTPVQVAGVQMAGDFVVISPAAAWPRDLVYTANGTGAEAEFKVQACNAGTQTVAGATHAFNYAIFGS